MKDLKKSGSDMIDPDDIGYNESNNPTFESILAKRLDRRNLLTRRT